MPADTAAFSYEELALATGGFLEANLLGQGGFAYMHRGVLADGAEVVASCSCSFSLSAGPEPMLMVVVVNARGRGRTGSAAGGIPTGYYGNAFALPVAVSTAGELCANPIGYAVGLVKEAKEKVDMEYMRSAADLAVLRRGRAPRIPAGLYTLTDQTKARFDDLDFGWGRPVYAELAVAVRNPVMPLASSFILPFKNADGEDGAVVPVCLPRPAMLRLVDEMAKLRRRRSPADMAML